jgi:hypothetical protein
MWELARKVNDAGGGIVAIAGLLTMIAMLFRKSLRLDREFEAQKTYYEEIIEHQQQHTQSEREQKEFWRARCLLLTDLVDRTNSTTQRAVETASAAVSAAQEARKS